MWRSLLLTLVKALIRLKFPSVQRITTAELAQRLQQGTSPHPLVLDARTEAEYAVSHLQTARQIDPSNSEQVAVSSLRDVPQNAPIVVYCSVGYRSARAAEQLTQAGFHCVYNLEGGIFQWANEGRSLLQNGQPTRQVHPYNATWEKLLKDAE